MKKILSLALALLMLLSCVSAFADAIPAEGYDGSEVTIKFRHIITKDDQLAILNDAIVEFNKIYPNIHVVPENVGGSYNGILETTTSELKGGNEPNIAFCYMDHVAAYNDQAGSMQVLDELIDHPVLGLTAEQKADFIPGYYKEGATLGDGKMYALPFYKSTEVLYYNKTFFDENNLTAPVTWDDLEAVCAKIKEINPKSIPLGYDSEGNWFITMTEQLGTPYTSATEPHYLFDNDQNKDFIRKINGWYNKGYVTTAGLYGTYTSGLFVSTEEMRSYMSIGSSAGATHQRPKKNDDGSYPFEVGIVPMPQVDPANPKAISQGPSVCIFAYKKPVQEILASWLFVKYLTTDVTFQARFSIASGYMPAIKSVMENPEYQGYLAKADGGDMIAAQSVKVGMSMTDAYFTSPVFKGSDVARNQVTALLKACLGMKPDEINTKIDSAFQDAIDECEYAN